MDIKDRLDEWNRENFGRIYKNWFLSGTEEPFSFFVSHYRSHVEVGGGGHCRYRHFVSSGWQGLRVNDVTPGWGEVWWSIFARVHTAHAVFGNITGLGGIGRSAFSAAHQTMYATHYIFWYIVKAVGIVKSTSNTLFVSSGRFRGGRHSERHREFLKRKQARWKGLAMITHSSSYCSVTLCRDRGLTVTVKCGVWYWAQDGWGSRSDPGEEIAIA